MDNDRFARTIKNARLKKGYTQSQLADLLNVSNKTISKWETGRGYPDITLLAKITSVLKLEEKKKRYFYHQYCLFYFCNYTNWYV